MVERLFNAVTLPYSLATGFAVVYLVTESDRESVCV
jgi:hypothetical protein